MQWKVDASQNGSLQLYKLYACQRAKIMKRINTAISSNYAHVRGEIIESWLQVSFGIYGILISPVLHFCIVLRWGNHTFDFGIIKLIGKCQTNQC